MTRFIFHADPAAWRQAIAAWIAADPVRCSLIAGIAALGVPGTWHAIVAGADGPIAALVQAPGWPAVIASAQPAEPAAIAAILAGWREHALAPPGINGPADWAEAIAAAVGRPARGRMDLRLHRLVGEPRLPRPTAGRARPWQAAELDLLRAWIRAFHRDIDAHAPSPPADAGIAADHLDRFLVWDDGGPASTARIVRPLLGGWSIAHVYTPPERRRRGYAGAVVHALCERTLAAGAAWLALYTDLANPTSNRLYADIGFAPVLDQARILWEAPA